MLNRPLFQLLLDIGHELIRRRAVNDAMIKGQGQDDHWPDRDGVIDNDRTFLDSSHAHDGQLGLVDDWSTNQAAVQARIRNGKCSLFDVVWCELLVARSFAEIIEGVRDA